MYYYNDVIYLECDNMSSIILYHGSDHIINEFKYVLELVIEELLENHLKK